MLVGPALSVFTTSLVASALIVSLDELRIRAGASQTLLGAFVAIAGGAAIAAQVFAGSRLSRGAFRSFLAAGTSLAGSGAVTLALTSHPWALLAGLVQVGVAGAVVAPAAYLAVSGDDRSAGTAIGIATSVDELGTLVGPFCGAVLLATTGLGSSLLVTGAVAFLAAAGVALLTNARIPSAEREEGSTGVQRFSVLLRPGVLAATLGLAAIHTPGGVFRALWDLFMLDVGGGNFLLAVSVGLASVTYIVLAPFGGRLSAGTGSERRAFATSSVLVLVLLGFGVVPGPGWVIALDVLYMVALAYMYPAFVNLVNRSTDEIERGTALGVVLGVSSLLSVPAAFVGSWLYETFGRVWAFSASALVVAVLSIVGAWQAHRQS